MDKLRLPEELKGKMSPINRFVYFHVAILLFSASFGCRSFTLEAPSSEALEEVFRNRLNGVWILNKEKTWEYAVELNRVASRDNDMEGENPQAVPVIPFDFTIEFGKNASWNGGFTSRNERVKSSGTYEVVRINDSENEITIRALEKGKKRDEYDEMTVIFITNSRILLKLGTLAPAHLILDKKRQ